MKNIALIGYSGHAYVVADIFCSLNANVTAYTETEEKNNNPYGLHYLGNESLPEVQQELNGYSYFVAVGTNALRRRITESLIVNCGFPVNAIHSSAIISSKVALGKHGIMVGPRAVINSMARIGDGVIINTGSIVEHECVIESYAHIAPGAVLCGNVRIGENTLIGAGSVILPGVTIGANVIVGSGCVVHRDVSSGSKIVGNPFRKI